MWNLSWFKTKKKEEELLDLQIRREKLITDELEKTIDSRRSAELGNMMHSATHPQAQWQPLPSKPYKKVKFVNDVLTVIFNDGSVINKAEATINDFNSVRNATTENEVINVMQTAVHACAPKEDEIKEVTGDDIYTVSHFPDFDIADECIYMNGIPRSVPPLLVQRFSEIINKYPKSPGWEERILEDVEYSSLKKFWLKCALNPNAQSAEDLYTFLSHHNMKIDRHGNFFAYRRVVKVNSYTKDMYGASDKIVGLISGAYNNVKAVWKKKPSDFRIEELNSEYSLHKVTSNPKGTIVGNLDTLYNNLPNMTENRYTDAHTHSMDYRVGQIASIPRNECDDNNGVNCGAGIHAASVKYSYEGFGDTDILMIINPMDAVAVPINEVGKLRICRFFFAMTLDYKDRFILDDKDFDVTELGDIFEEKCLKNIKQHVHQSFAEEVKRHTFTIPQMSNTAINDISNMLIEMNEVIKNRIVRQ